MDLIKTLPKVAIVDDQIREVEMLKSEFDRRNILSELFMAGVEPQFPQSTSTEIETIFLDLHLNEAVSRTFDPEFCADWVSRLVPEFASFALIFWSKDSHLGEAVLQELNTINRHPYFWMAAQKTDFQTPEVQVNVDQLLESINAEYNDKNTPDTIRMQGEILEVKDKYVLINCLVSEEGPVFQTRRFDIKLIDGYIDPSLTSYVVIDITTQRSKRTIEIHPNVEDMSGFFKQPDYFEKLKDSPFFNGK